MSSSPEASPAPEKKDDDELIVKSVIRQRDSDRPSAIIVSKGGVECTVTPRQVVKIDPEDMPDFPQPEAEKKDEQVKTRSLDAAKDGEEKQEKEKENPEQKPAEEAQPATQTLTQKVSSAFESAKNWFKSFF